MARARRVAEWPPRSARPAEKGARSRHADRKNLKAWRDVGRGHRRAQLSRVLLVLPAGKKSRETRHRRGRNASDEDLRLGKGQGTDSSISASRRGPTRSRGRSCAGRAAGRRQDVAGRIFAGRGREFARRLIGGVRDEAESADTAQYIGSLQGKILAIEEGGASNQLPARSRSTSSAPLPWRHGSRCPNAHPEQNAASRTIIWSWITILAT